MTRPRRVWSGDDIALRVGKPDAPEPDPAIVAWKLCLVRAENEQLLAECERLRGQLREQRVVIANLNRLMAGKDRMIDQILGWAQDIADAPRTRILVRPPTEGRATLSDLSDDAGTNLQSPHSGGEPQ